MRALASRLARLEERLGRSATHHERAFSCIVRKGREDEDRALAFADLGIEPSARDLVIMHVAVSPRPNDPMDGLKPYARLLA